MSPPGDGQARPVSAGRARWRRGAGLRLLAAALRREAWSSRGCPARPPLGYWGSQPPAVCPAVQPPPAVPSPTQPVSAFPGCRPLCPRSCSCGVRVSEGPRARRGWSRPLRQLCPLPPGGSGARTPFRPEPWPGRCPGAPPAAGQLASPPLHHFARILQEIVNVFPQSAVHFHICDSSAAFTGAAVEMLLRINYLHVILSICIKACRW